MTLWRLEWLRLVRSRRLISLLGVYVFFGFVGPLTARYLGAIIDRFGSGDLEITVPDPVPADGIAQFAANASQIGILVAVAIAAGSLTLGALPEMAIFLRTRVGSGLGLLLPRLAVSVAAVAGAYLIGTITAWYETVVLIGALPIGGMIGGLALTVLYLAFAVALTAAVGARAAGVLATVGITIVVLAVMPIIGIVEPIGTWLPSHLVGSSVDLITSGTLGDYVRAVVMTVAATIALTLLAVRSIAVREI